MPRTTYYELLLDASQPGNLARRYMIYDTETGDCIMSGTGVHLFRDGVGEKVEVRGKELVHLGISRINLPGGPPPHLKSNLPILTAIWILENPEYVDSIVPWSDGGLRVDLSFPRDPGGEREFGFVAEIDADGAIVRAWDISLSANGEGVEPWIYDDAFPRTWMVPSAADFDGQWTIEHLVALEHAPDGAFTDAVLATKVIEARTDPSDFTLDQINALREADGLGPVPLDPMTQAALDRVKADEGHPWRWPLVGGGVGVVAVGLFVWWRRRT